MRIKIQQDAENRHTDVVSCLGWASSNELFTCGDDHKILKWSAEGDQSGELKYPDGAGYIIDISWFPIPAGKAKAVATGGAAMEVYVLATSEGKMLLYNKGRIEKTVEAHKGATLCVRWNHDGSALLSAGEDGSAKIWSRTGMLRSTLIQTATPLYSVAWGPDGDQVLFCSGKNLVIKPLSPNAKQNLWKAHEGIVLKADWNPVNNLLVSGGEDRKYKVWDSYGRNIFSSALHDHPITSVAWSSQGDMFAVGSYNTIRVCDRAGWSYALAKPNTGSIFNIAWTADGTQLACGGGNGAVSFVSLVERRLEWKGFEVTINEDNKIIVKDVTNDTKETLDFRDRVIKVSLGYGHLVVATAIQCYIYTEKNLNTPSVVDLNSGGRVTTIIQSQNLFLLVDTVAGIQIYSYDGRPLSNPKIPHIRPEFLNPQTMSLSDDCLAVKDRADEKNVLIFDVATGKPMGEGKIVHHLEVQEVSLSQSTPRLAAIVDRNRDLYITAVVRPNVRKLGAMTEALSWNDRCNHLACLSDGKFVVWYQPDAVFVDPDLAPLVRLERDSSHDLGKGARFVYFNGSHCVLRRTDGALISGSGISPFPELLQMHCRKKHWEEAVRLCRYAKMKELWACLAAIAVQGQELNTAEVAYAAIEEIDKVQYMCYIKDIPSSEGRAAELALFRRQPKEAEQILIQGGLIYRAIRMAINLYNWDRALELAVKYKTHLDTVLWFRERYIKMFGRKETNKKFVQYAQGVTIDPDKIRAKIKAEEENERTARPGTTAKRVPVA